MVEASESGFPTSPSKNDIALTFCSSEIRDFAEKALGNLEES